MKFLVAGHRKDEAGNGNSAYNLNAYLYTTESQLAREFAWVDGPDGGNMRKGNQPLTLKDILDEVKTTGFIWCENDDFTYVFKAV